MVSRRPNANALASFAFLLGAAAPAAAQDGGRHAVVVLELPSSARAAALGDAYVGVGGDGAAVFYDPAQLATVRRAAGLSVERFFQGATLAAFSAATRLGRGALAVGVQSLRYDGVDETVDWEPTGRGHTAGDVVASVGYGVDLGPLGLRGVAGVRVGAVAKHAWQRVAEATGSAAAGDVSLAVALRGGVVVSAVARNLGGEIELLGRASPLPRRAVLGAAAPLAVSPRLSLLATAAVAHVAHQGTRLAGGAEVRWRARGDASDARGSGLALDLRAGLRERTHGAAASPVTVGGGVGAGRLALDYAYQGYSVLGATHRLGVRWAR